MSKVTSGSVKVKTNINLDLTETQNIEKLSRYWLDQMSAATLQGADLAAQKFYETSLALKELAEERDRLVRDYEALSQEIDLSGD